MFVNCHIDKANIMSQMTMMQVFMVMYDKEICNDAIVSDSEPSLAVEMGVRLREWADTYASYNVCAAVVGVDPGQLNKWMMGRFPMSLPNILKLAAADPLLNLHWLLTGIGSMRRTETDRVADTFAEQRVATRALLLQFAERQRAIADELSTVAIAIDL